MMIHSKLVAMALVALAGAGSLCPICGAGAGVAEAQQAAAVTTVSDTATVKLHISGMTCGSCPVTARIALKKMTGVYSAKVTLDDSLGVVMYDPKRVTPAQITGRLTRLTGYGATVIGESAKPGGKGSR